MNDRTVADVIRDLGALGDILIGGQRRLCFEAAELLAVTDHGYTEICKKNDELQELVGPLTVKSNRLFDYLTQIRDVCKDNAPATCDHRMALNFVRQVASRATHVPGTTNLAPRDVRDIVKDALEQKERGLE